MPVQASTAGSRACWPVFAPHASGAGFQMICAVPLRAGTDVIGALNMFRGSDELFTETEMGDSAGHDGDSCDRGDAPRPPGW